MTYLTGNVTEVVGDDSRCIMSTLQYDSEIFQDALRADCYEVRDCDSSVGTYNIIVTN